ncbi:MAG: thioredoxin family protein, partial [Myxococcales bacterium]|nr:thioredoxin family protein [Myxococcales bacterium]
SFDEAMALAQEQNTQVLIDMYATWCGPCHRLDAEVFPQPDVTTSASGLITLKINAEEGEGPALVERYHVVGYPTVLLIGSDGQEVDRIFGYLDAPAFAETLTGFRQGQGTIDELRAAQQANPEDLQLAAELGRRAAIRGEYAEAQALLDRVIEEDADNALGLRVEAHHTLGKYMYLRGQRDYARALEQFAIIEADFPDTPEARDSAYQVAVALVRDGQSDRALQTLEGWLANAEGADEYNSVAWLCYQEEFAVDQAIAWARQGLEVDPGADSLWDTLAELLSLSGDHQAAVEATRTAIELAPSEEYYQQQLTRFQARLDAAN